METLIVCPKTKEQLEAIKTFLKALEINFEKKEYIENYDPEFVKTIKVAEERANYKTIDPKNLWESFTPNIVSGRTMCKKLNETTSLPKTLLRSRSR